MYSFLGGLVILILGYCIYGAIVNKVFGPDDRTTPCVALSISRDLDQSSEH